MPAPGMPAASAITVRHPEGTIRVRARTDVPLGELLPDVLEVAGLPGHQDWVLGPLDGPPYAPDRTLAQLGVDDGALLALGEIPANGSAGSENAPTQHPGEWPTLASTEGAGGRPLSDRNARILPVRLSIPARCLSVLGALARGDRGEQHCDRESAVLGPARFTRPPRLSPVARVRKAWAHSDYTSPMHSRVPAPSQRQSDPGVMSLSAPCGSPPRGGVMLDSATKQRRWVTTPHESGGLP